MPTSNHSTPTATVDTVAFRHNCEARGITNLSKVLGNYLCTVCGVTAVWDATKVNLAVYYPNKA